MGSAVKEFVTKKTWWPFQLRKMKPVMENRGIAWVCLLTATVDFRKATITTFDCGDGDDGAEWNDASLATSDGTDDDANNDAVDVDDANDDVVDGDDDVDVD